MTKREGFSEVKDVNGVENVQIHNLGGWCDGVLAQLVIGQVWIRVKGDPMRQEGKEGGWFASCLVRLGDGIYTMRVQHKEISILQN